LAVVEWGLLCGMAGLTIMKAMDQITRENRYSFPLCEMGISWFPSPAGSR
jgi:hypothetical protein